MPDNGLQVWATKVCNLKFEICNSGGYAFAVGNPPPIHLESAARTLPRSMYEPEQFPGLIHRMLDPKTVILLFASGKLVCTGAKKEADVYRSVNNLHALLEEKKLMIYDQ